MVQKAVADIEAVLSNQAEKPMQRSEKEPEKETKKPREPQIQDDKGLDMPDVEKASEPVKTAEKAPKTGRDVSEGTGKKQSVLTALRERQAKLKAQEQGISLQKPQARGKGEKEL